MYELFVRQFPYWERILKEPSNGLVHAANQITAFGSLTPSQITTTELGNATDDTNTYNRLTFPIATFLSRRGVSLKEQFAVRQGGAPYNPEEREIRGGVTQIAHAIQYHMLQGNSSYAAQTATSEAGVYNANGFDGLRIVTGQVPGSAYAVGGATPSGSPYVDADNASQLGYASLPANPITAALLKATALVRNNGGNPSAVLISETAKYKLLQEQTQFLRFMGTNEATYEFTPGFKTEYIATQAGRLPVIGIPGDSVGTYNRVSDGVLVEDAYVLDEVGLSAPWLGQENITALEVPIGANAQLSQLYLTFQLVGFKQAGPLFTAKVRLPVASFV